MLAFPSYTLPFSVQDNNIALKFELPADGIVL